MQVLLLLGSIVITVDGNDDFSVGEQLAKNSNEWFEKLFVPTDIRDDADGVLVIQFLPNLRVPIEQAQLLREVECRLEDVEGKLPHRLNHVDAPKKCAESGLHRECWSGQRLVQTPPLRLVQFASAITAQ